MSDNPQSISSGSQLSLTALMHAISCDVTDMGKPRITSTITIFTEGDYVKVALKDRERELTLFRSGRSILEALTATEIALREDARDWRKTGRRKT